MLEEKFSMIAQCMFGFEDLLQQELRDLGIYESQILNRAVRFEGGLKELYTTNLQLRTAIRVLVPVLHFEAENENDLYLGMFRFSWEQLFSVDQTFAVSCTLHTKKFNHSQYVALKSKDAIVDRFRKQFGKRPDVDARNPDIKITIHISDNKVAVSIDSSGEPLYKRGYRDETNLAPINEVLAASLLLRTGYNGSQVFVDPMAGSGTFLIEAALLARKIPPGAFRRYFGFSRWKNYDKELWHQIGEAASAQSLEKAPQPIMGGELSENVYRKARVNLKEAEVDEDIQLYCADFAELRNPGASEGIMLMNPPYGERMHQEDIALLYAKVGSIMKQNWSGFSVWILTSNLEAAKKIGLKPSRKVVAFNGALECRFFNYAMYSGTKRTFNKE
jgi:putative N6-adenine-specific DNA methylase